MTLLKDIVTNSLYFRTLFVQNTQLKPKGYGTMLKMGLDPFLLQAQLFSKCREDTTCSEEDTVALWQQNLFLATKRDIKMNNDSSPQALNRSLNPNPGGRRITVIVLPCVNQTFLQNYTYSKKLQTAKEHPPLCSAPGHRDLTENLFQPQRFTLHILPQPPQCLCTIYWYKTVGLRTRKGNFYFERQTIIYWEKWHFGLSYLYTVSTLCTCIYGQHKELNFLGIPCHGKVRCTLILQAKLVQSKVLQCFSPEWSHSSL